MSYQPFSLTFTVHEAEAGLLLREFLSLKQLSKRAVAEIKYSGGTLSVNQQRVNVLYQLKKGDIVQVQYPPENINEKIIPYDFPLDIVYEDDYFLVANKPAGMSTIPSREHPDKTLANALTFHYQQIGHRSSMHFVTRLDYDTSGLTLIAKHSHIHHLFDLAQAKKEITKNYLALIEGQITPPQGEIKLPIARVPGSAIKREVNPNGKYACTLYETEQIINNHSLLKLQLLTGRTHQIRVHLAALGYPILGDSLYGGNCDLIKRQALHCCYLQLQHPLTGELLKFECAPPKDMQALMQ